MNSEFYRTGATRPNQPDTGPQPEYRISLTLSVADEPALWSAAAARLLAMPGMVINDVIDVIGPREDPSIIACLSALAKPVSLPGCTLDDFWIDGLKGCPPRSGYEPVVEDGPAMPVEQPVRRPARRATGPALYLCGRRVDAPDHR